MRRSRCLSSIEAASTVAAGRGLAIATHMLVFPLLERQATFADTLALGSIFTVVSIAGSYALRRP